MTRKCRSDQKWHYAYEGHNFGTLYSHQGNVQTTTPSRPTLYSTNAIAVQSSQIRRSKRLYNTCTFTKSRPEYPIRILEHAILQTNNDELTSLEPGLDEPTNILRMGQIKSGINFVQNVHWCRLELKKSEDERKRNK